jgi:hypothetical protein
MGAAVAARKGFYAFASQPLELLPPTEEQVSAFSDHDGIVYPTQ